jgi:hypothetical protein
MNVRGKRARRASDAAQKQELDGYCDSVDRAIPIYLGLSLVVFEGVQPEAAGHKVGTIGFSADHTPHTSRQTGSQDLRLDNPRTALTLVLEWLALLCVIASVHLNMIPKA